MPDFEVVSLPDTDHVAEGDTAPDFTRPLVNDEYWEDTALSDLTDEGPVLLVFYTMDGAFPATYIWNEIRDRAWDSESQRASDDASGVSGSEATGGSEAQSSSGETASSDLTIVGLSISDPYAHKQLVEERGMDYRLFSDPQSDVAEEYGIAHDLDGMAGVSEPRPAVFLLDEDRTIEYAWVAEKWPEFPDYDEIEDVLADY